MDTLKWLDESHEVVDVFTSDNEEYVEIRFEDGTGASYTKEEYGAYTKELK